MEGFYAFCIWTFVTCAASFGAGRYLPMGDIASTIERTGEVEIQKTIYQCKPVALKVKERRVEIER